jgi:hypothetical protein
MACGLRNAGWLADFECGEDVGDQPVLRPVAAADDVAGAHCGDGHAVLCMALELKKDER